MCTRKQISAEEFERAGHLHALGVAVDYDEFEQMRAESAGLTIFQNSDVPSLILDLPSGRTGCCFNVVIANDSDCDMLTLRSILFDGPEWLYQLRLIPDRRLTKGSKYPNQYFLHPDEQGYDRECVLNHRLGRKFRLAPGEQADGFLLAAADYRIPADYREYDKIKVGVKLFDQHGRPTSWRFGLTVQRDAEHRRAVKIMDQWTLQNS
jgi:hypothetical protein